MSTFHQPPDAAVVRDMLLFTRCEEWSVDFIASGGRLARDVEYIFTQAEIKARQYREMGTSYDDFQPGNGTSYKLVLHDMIAPYVRLMVERDRENFAEVTEELWLIQLGCYLHRQDETGNFTEKDIWRYAFDRTMAGRAGGELLVSLPENGGRCGVFSVGEASMFVPEYVADHLGVCYADSVPLAIYLSAFVSALWLMRAARVTV